MAATLNSGSGPDDQLITWTVAEHSVAFAGGLSDQGASPKITLLSGQTSVWIEDVGSDTSMFANETYGAAAGGSKTFEWEDVDDNEDWMASGASFIEDTAAEASGRRRVSIE